ncbi:hypothetical protein [Methylomonas rosea]|uniref:PEP-CTERM sorting domain-containing protein n=1 Tax=Methylomonas rosea TaxID=2952227 RepID=A0ABT1TP09_9GAMM|nr:hypothetical protein [Methylomonas sp. WSC-7]MCQ8116516.1 hypothetical protein [Methylomonas sp. WSC-7]
MEKYVFSGLNASILPILVSVLLAIVPLKMASASVLGHFDVKSLGGTIGLVDYLWVTVDFGGNQNLAMPTTGGVAIDIILSESDAGRTFIVNSGAEFDQAVGYLSNGINDSITSWVIDGSVGGGVGSFANEAYFFFGDISGANGIDFAGYSIDSISLAVTELSFTQSSDWTDVIFKASVAINGSPVPIPGGTYLFASGLVFVWGCRKGQGAR